MVTVPAMMPLYARLGMDPLVLTCTTALAAGTMNILPWGGPASRVATVLQMDVGQVFAPLAAATAAGMVAVFGFAALIGYAERRRLSTTGVREIAAVGARNHHAASGPSARLSPAWWFNLALTIVTLGALVVEILPLPVVFLIASAVALVVNFPAARDQQERLTAHGSSAMVMVTTVLAAGLFAGVMTKTGMLTAMARDVVGALPSFVLEHLAVGVAVASMPLSLAFDPDSFYFGVLPVLSTAAETAGGSGLDVARAALLGQMTTGFPVSPLTPATFLLVGLAQVDLADHQRRTIPYAFGVTLVMTMAALATGAIGW
jgi:CitMHS family citrate-Mg2+:H+ or citrate-Ca2+:H+ symporter